MSRTLTDPVFLSLPFEALADAALSRAKQLGASYADFRFERLRGQTVVARDRELQTSVSGESIGFSVRVIKNGSWGFAAGVDLTSDAAAAIAARAVDVAGTLAPLNVEPVVLADEPVYTDSYVSRCDIDPFAVAAQIYVGMHNHSKISAGEFATPQSFLDAMAGNSKYICINLDIGHFTAAGFDAVDYLSKHHDRIVTLHIKDRKRDHGANLPFGEGDTPIKQVLALLRDKKWKIPANIEYEYKGADTVAEVKKCYEYCRRALEM